MEGATRQRAITRRGDRGLAASAMLGLTGLAVAMIAVAAWPVQTIEPNVAGGWGWIATLSYAAEHGLRFGERIVWSYGPARPACHGAARRERRSPASCCSAS